MYSYSAVNVDPAERPVTAAMVQRYSDDVTKRIWFNTVVKFYESRNQKVLYIYIYIYIPFSHA